ncbi:MAG: hypothetical protein ACYTFG_06075, partial [Planctomycetota bacterium]
AKRAYSVDCLDVAKIVETSVEILSEEGALLGYFSRPRILAAPGRRPLRKAGKTTPDSFVRPTGEVHFRRVVTPWLIARCVGKSVDINNLTLPISFNIIKKYHSKFIFQESPGKPFRCGLAGNTGNPKPEGETR